MRNTWETSTLTNIGVLFHMQGPIDDALTYLQQALPLDQQLKAQNLLQPIKEAIMAIMKQKEEG